MEADADGNAAIAEIEGVCMPLRAVTDDGDFFGLN